MKLHPEQGDGELYLGDTTARDFANCAWVTKRLGTVALDLDGRAIKGVDEYRPMFILASEVEGKIRGEEMAQGPNWTEKVRVYRQMLADRSAS